MVQKEAARGQEAWHNVRRQQRLHQRALLAALHVASAGHVPKLGQRATSVPRVEWQETRGLVVISWVTCLVILAFVLLALFPDLRAFDWEDHEATWIVPEERVHLSLLQGGRVLVKTAAV